ncbi:3-oxoacyl-[acyl-carrier-protein] synthase III C-terminal domain-containing protein [Pectobacterium carotovorum]|uniref:3-oxoacyl-[acyl-carrier-protein] synthase III C-terminal domain-containing protein n=1 Tax=Pectobacterium carotovorum TaxID=554 RepID=UPI0020864F5F|nr:3-oxoacyl-[acyl-carrier-protein] synthase III C-terminal domain-containing protein [Pectobacterium carotovorum]GKW39574.1 3-oxoacyl-ACP synthase [Pectobacterium carotovorum subsp. carotovorum]
MLKTQSHAFTQGLVPLKIISTGSALPAQRVTSAELDVLLNKPAGYVESRSGIIHRHHADNHASQAELGVAALNDALARGIIPPASIDLLLFASAIPIQALPYSASHLLKVSSLPKGTACFDINSSCVSFISALQVAAGLLNTGAYRRIAIVSTELASRGIDWDDEESSLIFGDGAACAIVERGDGRSGIAACLLETYPKGNELCQIRAGGTLRNPRAGMELHDFLFHMQGKRLFRQASALIEGYLQRLLDASGYSLDQMAAVVPHQASHLSLEHMRKRLAIPTERLIDIYRYHGNQVAASIPTALHHAIMTQRLPEGEPAMLVGTAAGLTLGGMVLIP